MLITLNVVWLLGHKQIVAPYGPRMSLRREKWWVLRNNFYLRFRVRKITSILRKKGSCKNGNTVLPLLLQNYANNLVQALFWDVEESLMGENYRCLLFYPVVSGHWTCSQVSLCNGCHKRNWLRNCTSLVIFTYPGTNDAYLFPKIQGHIRGKITESSTEVVSVIQAIICCQVIIQ